MGSVSDGSEGRPESWNEIRARIYPSPWEAWWDGMNLSARSYLVEQAGIGRNYETTDWDMMGRDTRQKIIRAYRDMRRGKYKGEESEQQSDEQKQ